MITPNTRSHPTETEQPLDDLMANLMVLVTHHSLTRCEAALPKIIAQIDKICGHSEIEHYPSQIQVLIKMQRLWRTQLFQSQVSNRIH